MYTCVNVDNNDLLWYIENRECVNVDKGGDKVEVFDAQTFKQIVEDMESEITNEDYATDLIFMNDEVLFGVVPAKLSPSAK